MAISVFAQSFPGSAPKAPGKARVIVKLRNQPAQSLAQAVAPGTNTVNLAGVPAADRNLGALLSKHAVRRAAPLFHGAVRAKRQQGLSEAQMRNAMRQRFPRRAARAPASVASPDLSSTYVFELSDRPAAEVAETIRSLQADANVLYAEEDHRVQVQYVPNDPSYSSTGSWGQNYDDLYGLKKIGTTQAWDATHGQGVVVAVIDTGIDYNHPDLSDNIWVNSGEIPGNGIDDDNNGFIDDVRGWDFVGASSTLPVEDNDPFDGHSHGTHVAGTIAATGNNNLGVVGVAWQAKVMAVKGLGDDGYGYESELAQAIIYAVDNGADVINASWGVWAFSQTETDAINYAHSRGVVFVAAAGNSTADTKYFTPANVPAAIAVSSLNPSDNLSYFSNFGSKVELAAPGEDILSLEAGTGGYTRKSGTSMATPHVSGVAALIIAQHPTYSNEQVRQALRASATDLGDAGRDSSFGYGRVNAAQAVLVNQALEAKILDLIDGTMVSAPLALTGSAGGQGFDHYVVDYGAGASPGSWTTLRNSSTSVANADIGTFNPSSLSDGTYTIRLRAFSTEGSVFSDQIQVAVNYVEITWPLPPPVPSVTMEIKPGAPFQIFGRATGASFQSFSLDWAPGSAATSGWSNVGISLTAGGLVPIVDGSLGNWTPPSSLNGYYTIRLTVTNAGFSSTTATVVYVEPALASAGWPQAAGEAYTEQSAVSVLQPDGSTRFVLSGTHPPSRLYSYAVDGSSNSVPLDNGSYVQSAVGDLDGQPGDEIVVPDGSTLKIFSSDLTLIRSITFNPQIYFRYDQISLVDLDNDGEREIIAISRNQALDPATGEQVGEMHVYRSDGSRFSENAPPSFSTHWAVDVRVVAVDLNGDARKEIVLGFDNAGVNSYTLKAFNADGSAYTGWPPLLFSNRSLRSVATADLDHDGTHELVVAENNPADGAVAIRVLNRSGVIRTGWPVTVESSGYTIQLAIGDLDRDQQDEIVAATQSNLSVLRANGTLWNTPWSTGGNAPLNQYLSPLIADTDGDGLPEILFGLTAVDSSSASTPFRRAALTSYRSDGTIKQSWPLFGAQGKQPNLVGPQVGDFNGDGITDLVVTIGLVEGGGMNGELRNSALTWLTIGTPFNAADSDWVSNFRDPQNSRNATVTTPAITTQPADQTLPAGSAATLSVAASGDPLPTFQWKKNGTPISGATRAKLTIPSALVSDSGSYTVVVTNLKGLATSNPATLTVNKSTPAITWPVPAPITYGTALSVTQLDATVGVPGTFAYSPAAGTVLNAGTHTLNLTFTPTDSANYNTATMAVSLTVNKATPVVTWSNPSAITYGTALSATQLNATANTAGAFNYSPMAGTVLNAGTHTLNLTFTPTDSANYDTTTVLVSLTVKAIPVITWNDPSAITYGTALSSTQLNATTNIAGTFTYSSAAGTVPDAGTHTLSTTFTPTDSINYATTTKSVSLTVDKATPVVTWNTPSAITYGTALSDAQLNATVGIGGTFAYSPMAGTVLNAGTHTLSATFTPSDSANYNTATQSVNLAVNKAPLVVTAADASRSYGSANPGFTITMSGFVNGESISVVAGAPAFTTPADRRSDAGLYSVTPSVGTLTASNYSFSLFLNGTLSVTKVMLTATADNQAKLLGAANPPLTVSYAGFVNGENAASLTVRPVAATPAADNSPAGTYPITLSGGVSSNYDFTYVAGVLSVMTQSIAPSSAVISITVE